MSDTPNPNTPNEKSAQEPSLNLEKLPEQSSEPNPNTEQAQNLDAPNQEPTPKPNNTLAMLCFVCGLLGLFRGGGVPPIVNMAAIAMGHMARSQIRQNPNEGGAGIALAGLIMAYIGWLTAPIIMAFTIFAFSRGNWASTMEVFFGMLFFGAGIMRR